MAANDSSDPILAVFQQQERERDVRAEIEATLVLIVRAQVQLDAVRKRLVRKPAWEHEADSFLGPAVAERGRLALHLGLLCAEWQLQGGEITLSRPSDEVPKTALLPTPPVSTPVPSPPPPAPSAPVVVPPPAPSVPVEAAVAAIAAPPTPVPPPRISEAVVAPPPSPPPSAPISAPVDVGPPMDAAQLQAFKESFLKGASIGSMLAKSAASTEWRTTLTQLMALAGPPADPFDDKERDRELAVLDLVTGEKHVKMWPMLPKEIQRPWMGLLVARCRGLKDVASLRIDHRATVQEILKRFPAYASQERPGHVNGLRVDHRAQGRSWFEDARGYWEHLKSLMPDDEPPPLKPRAEPTKPKKKAVKKDKEEKDEEKREIVSPDWSLWPLVRGRHAVIIGGEPRETSRERLEEVFELADLEWLPGDATRKHEGLVERIASHRVELVLVIQNLVTHKAADKLVDACKQHQVAWAFISGYGATAVQQGLERYVDRKLRRGAVGAR